MHRAVKLPMWVLSTARAELRYFESASAAADVGYAILSHYWDGHKQTFQETQDIRRLCDANGTNARDSSSPKVRESCKLAERLGSELSEAINSMWTYYSLAEWATRGWTLQELIAPPDVLFLSKGWKIEGNRHDLADALHAATNIPTAVLTREEDIYSFSVAERMSWASRRETTRIEDEAYSLFGIFNVNLPPLYGEGRKACLRLQEEIMKNTTDTSLFAWEVAYTIHLTVTARNPDTLSELALYNTVPSMTQFWITAVQRLEWRLEGQQRMEASPTEASRASSPAAAASLGLGDTVEEPGPSVEPAPSLIKDSSIEEESEMEEESRESILATAARPSDTVQGPSPSVEPMPSPVTEDPRVEEESQMEEASRTLVAATAAGLAVGHTVEGLTLSIEPTPSSTQYSRAEEESRAAHAFSLQRHQKRRATELQQMRSTQWVLSEMKTGWTPAARPAPAQAMLANAQLEGQAVANPGV
ncbi:hypothetical protein C8Q80DRAFT_1266846 [Daedaleopsis nitida]|nr:hypothetical protein C8Q80DRAFT_1266846 [Daedaleopsis nitida]